MNRRDEFVKAGYHVLVWITAVALFAVYIKYTGRIDDATFNAAVDYSSEKLSFNGLAPELLFGFVLIGVSSLFKAMDLVKVCREEFVSIFYTWWSALCATMVFLSYYFYMHSQNQFLINGLSCAAIGYLTLFVAFVPVGRWISR